MTERLIFSELAQKLGVDMKKSAPVNGQHPNAWLGEAGKQAREFFAQFANPGEYIEYDGHCDGWLMLAILYDLRMCDINAYMAAPFEKNLKVCSYRLGDTPDPEQPVFFDVKNQGDSVLLTCKLVPEKGPFDMYFGDIVAPVLPEGKDIYVRLEGRHLLYIFPLALTYGDSARSIWMDYGGECVCGISHRPDAAPGDLGSCPFV
jgi:hypothetical protein